MSSKYYDLAMAINMENHHLKNGDDLPKDRMWKIPQDSLDDFGTFARSKNWITMRQFVNYLYWYYTTEQ
jgi:hypothetical protein